MELMGIFAESTVKKRRVSNLEGRDDDEGTEKDEDLFREGSEIVSVVENRAREVCICRINSSNVSNFKLNTK